MAVKGMGINLSKETLDNSSPIHRQKKIDVLKRYGLSSIPEDPVFKTPD